jgi:CysZ protein
MIESNSTSRRFFLGFGFVFSGIDLLRAHKDLRKWAIIPWIIDIILLGFGISAGGKHISKWVKSAVGLILPEGSSFHGLLYYPLILIFWMVFIGVMIYLLYLIAGLIASPFNSILADRTLAKLGAKKAEDLSIIRVGALAIRMALISVARAVILILLGFFIFILAFIPGLNFLALFFAFLVICFDGADYSFEVLEFSLRERFLFLRKYFVEFAGMASFVGLTLMVPGLILLLMPAAVVGCAYVIQRIRMRAEG